MRRLSAILGSLAVSLAVLLPAATAQAARIPPRITWSGVAVSPTGSTTCQIASQTVVTFTVTGLTGRAAWTVTAIGEDGSNIVVALPLGTVTKADNGATESVTVGPGSVSSSSGQVTFWVKLFDPSGSAVDTVASPTQDC
jgi:hypothetical protein